ncbi:MAG: SPOR domain-containing protein [Mariprofundaceae bacterium]|nr:SPOR domain-containing protein [Mariprofundaceae bacterium]
MAGQDFAQIEAPQPEDVRPMGRSKVLLLTMMALAVVAGGFVVGFMVGHEMGIQKATSDDDERLLAQLKQQQGELAKLRAEARKRQPEVSTTQVGELTFYNELPKQSVDPEPMQMNRGQGIRSAGPDRNSKESTTSQALLKQIIEQEMGQKKSEKPADAAGGYYLQLASFQKQSAAETFFPKLEKSGFPGVIRRVELPGLGTWYRVYAGPFDSEETSEEARKSVKNSININGLIVKEALSKSP